MTTLLMSQPPSLAIYPLHPPSLLLSCLPKALPPTRQSRLSPFPLTPTYVFPSPCHPPIFPKLPSPLSTWARMTAASTLMIFRRRSSLLTFQSRVSFCARFSLAASCALCGAYIAVDRPTHLTFGCVRVMKSKYVDAMYFIALGLLVFPWSTSCSDRLSCGDRIILFSGARFISL